MSHRYREPDHAIGGLYPVPVTPAVFVERDIVVEDEDVASDHLIEEAEPWQEARLQDGDDRQTPRSFPARSCDNIDIKIESTALPSRIVSARARPSIWKPARW